MGNEVSSEQEAPAPSEQAPRTGTVPICLRWPHGGKTAYICGSFTHWQKMPMQWRQTGATGEWFKVIDLTPGTHQYKFIIDGQWRHDHTAPTVLDNLGNVNNCTQVDAAPASSADAASSSQQPTGGLGSPDGRRASPAPDSASRGGADGAGRSADKRGDKGDRDAGGRSDPDMGAWPSDPYLSKSRNRSESYGQVVPAREELLVHHTASLLLPPQLRLLLPHHHGGTPRARTPRGGGGSMRSPTGRARQSRPLPPPPATHSHVPASLSRATDATTMPLAVQMHHVFCNISDEVSVFAVAHRYRERSVTQLLYKPAIGLIKERAAAGIGGAAGAGVGAGVGADGADPSEPMRRISELRHLSRDVALQSVRVPGAQRERDADGGEFTVYLVDSVLMVHGVQTTLRSVAAALCLCRPPSLLPPPPPYRLGSSNTATPPLPLPPLSFSPAHLALPGQKKGSTCRCCRCSPRPAPPSLLRGSRDGTSTSCCSTSCSTKSLATS